MDIDENSSDQENQIDSGMTGLAKSLGLDIEARALELALNDSTPPIHCQPVNKDNGQGATNKKEEAGD